MEGSILSTSSAQKRRPRVGAPFLLGSGLIAGNRLVSTGHEGQAFLIAIDDDRVAILEVTGQEALRQHILDAPLNRAPQRPCSVVRVEAFARQPFAGSVGQLQRQLVIGETLLDRKSVV